MSDIYVTGVSFGDEAIEIIFLDEDEQSDKVGFLHTAYLDYNQTAELRQDFMQVQAILVGMITAAYDIKNGKQSSVVEFPGD